MVYSQLWDTAGGLSEWQAMPVNMPNSGVQPVSCRILKPNLPPCPTSGPSLQPHLMAEYNLRACSALVPCLWAQLHLYYHLVRKYSLGTQLTRSDYRGQFNHEVPIMESSQWYHLASEHSNPTRGDCSIQLIALSDCQKQPVALPDQGAQPAVSP